MDAARVWTIRLPHVAALLNCTESELFEAMSRQADAIYAKPLAPHPASSAAIDLSYPPPTSAAATRQALVSTVSTERAAVPRSALVHVSGHTLLAHLLRQLLDAGIRRVVLVARAGEAAARVRRAIAGSAFPQELVVEVVEVAHDFERGYTGSLLAASEALDGNQPFLLVRSERAFAPALVRALAESHLPVGIHARISVESERGYYEASALPASCARARLDKDGERVREVGALSDNGLPLLTGLALLDQEALSAIFRTRLEAVADGRGGECTLADVLALLAREESVLALDTGGALWCAHETDEQLLESRKLLAHGINAATPAAGAEADVAAHDSTTTAAAAGALAEATTGPLSRAAQPGTLPAGVTPAGATSNSEETVAGAQLGSLLVGLGVAPAVFAHGGQSHTLNVGALQPEDAAIVATAATAATAATDGGDGAAEEAGLGACVAGPAGAGLVRGFLLDATPMEHAQNQPGSGARCAEGGGGDGSMTCSPMLLSCEHARVPELPYALALELPSAMAASRIAPTAVAASSTPLHSASAQSPHVEVAMAGLEVEPSDASAVGGGSAEAFLIELPQTEGGEQGERRHVVALFKPEPPAEQRELQDATTSANGPTGSTPSGAVGAEEADHSITISGEEDVNAFWARIGFPALPSGIDSVTITAKVKPRRVGGAGISAQPPHASAEAQRFALSAQPPAAIAAPSPPLLPSPVVSPRPAARFPHSLLRAESSVLPIYTTPLLADFADTGLEPTDEPRAVFASPLLVNPADLDANAAAAAASSHHAGIPSTESKRSLSALIVEVVVSRSVPSVGWIILACALLGSSSGGFAYALIGGKPSALTILFWRLTAITTVFAAPTAISICTSSKLRRVLTSRGVWLLLLTAAVGTAFQNGCFAIAVAHTSPANALLFNNMTPIFLLALKALRGNTLEPLEIGGAAVAILGGLIVCNSSAPAFEPPAEQRSELLANLVALAGSLGGVLYLTTNAELRPLLPAPVQFGLVNALAAACVFPLALTLAVGGERAPLDCSRDGMFGWARPEPDRLGVFAYIVLVSDSIGSLGWVVSLRYFSPLAISVVILLLPIASVVEGVVTRLRAAPSFLSMLGLLTLICGTLEVVVAESTGGKEERIDATSALADPTLAHAVANAAAQASHRSCPSEGGHSMGAPLLPQGLLRASDSVSEVHHDVEVARPPPPPRRASLSTTQHL